MIGFGLILAATLGTTAPAEPALWLHPKGTVLVGGKPGPSRLTEGASVVRTPYGLGLDVGGKKGGLLLRDLDPIILTQSMTVSTWLYLRDYAKAGSNAQILFRGDDRGGNDPYELCVHDDGTVNFGVGKRDDAGVFVSANVILNQWVRVTASYDDKKHELKIWLDDRLISTRTTDRRPFEELEVKFRPGVGVGNVQNDEGPHNQPLNGILADLRIYASVLGPAEAGWQAAKL